MRPFRFGVQSSMALGAASWRDDARKLEELGYSTLFMPDHFDDQWSPLVALTVAARATSRLKVGSVETLVERRETMGFSYWVLHDGDVDAFAPVVARLAGT